MIKPIVTAVTTPSAIKTFASFCESSALEVPPDVGGGASPYWVFPPGTGGGGALPPPPASDDGGGATP